MASIREIAREHRDEIRLGIAWVVVYKIGRSWEAEDFWLDCETDEFEPEDIARVKEIAKIDENAVMLNGYYCGHLGEDMSVEDIARGIRWHYENKCNLLADNIPEEPEEDESSEEDSRFPHGYAEIEYSDMETAEAREGAKFDDLNFLRYFER